MEPIMPTINRNRSILPHPFAKFIRQELHLIDAVALDSQLTTKERIGKSNAFFEDTASSVW